MEVVQVICFAERSADISPLCSQPKIAQTRSPLPGPRTALRWWRVDAVVHRKRQRPNDKSHALTTSSCWCQKESQSLAMGWFRFTVDYSFGSIIHFVLIHSLAFVHALLAFEKLWMSTFLAINWRVWAWAWRRGCSCVSHRRPGRGGCIRTLSVWSFMQRYQIIHGCMVVCKVCEIDAVSLLPEGSFAPAWGECPCT